MKGQVIEADWTWRGDKFEQGVRVTVSEDGYIESVGLESRPVDCRLEGQALLPGMISAHSHAFQRGLRGRGEAFPAETGSFWSWREEMYRLVASLDAEGIYRLSRQAFSEMLSAGITAVGEFHYLHHDASGSGFALDKAVLQAARDEGIRIVLLQTYYRTGGIGRPLEGAQKRFGCDSPKAFWKQLERLWNSLSPNQMLGAAAHSIRAAPIEDIVELHSEARRQGMVFHMHVEEQNKEIEECFEAYQASPIMLINQHLKIGPDFTAVHATQTHPIDMYGFLQAGGNVCICPLTEANLGDGNPDAPGILEDEGPISIGTDSNSRLSMVEEMRWLEYVQRVLLRRRGIFRDDKGKVARRLFGCATLNGARSLGLPAGEIKKGSMADFTVLDLSDPSLVGWRPETLMESFVFGTGNSAIAGSCVGGCWTRGFHAKPQS